MVSSAKAVPIPVQKDKEGRGSQGSIGRGQHSFSPTSNNTYVKDFVETHGKPLRDLSLMPLAPALWLADDVEEFRSNQPLVEHTKRPAGSSFEEFVSNAGSGLTNAITSAAQFIKDGFTDSTTAQSGVSAKPIVYSDWSPASKLFGMNQETAFSEHMANTAHQREVADLKAAGLNPVLGISGTGASSVSGNSAVGSSSAEKASDFPWIDVLGATAGLVTTVVTKKPSLGYMVANVFKAFDK